MDTYSYKENLIIDLGACYCKSGLSNEIIEKNKENNQSLEYYTLKSGYCEHESKDEEIADSQFHTKEGFERCRKSWTFKYPLKLKPEDYYREYPDFYDFDDIYSDLNLDQQESFLQNMYKFLFEHFELSPRHGNVLLTEKGFMPKLYKKIDAKIMFEELGIENLYIANVGVLNLLSQEKSTGVSIDIGYTTTQITPVVDGCKIGTNLSLNCSVKDIDEYLKKEYKKIGGHNISSFERYREKNGCSFNPNSNLKEPYIEGKPFRTQFLKSPEVIFDHSLNPNSSLGVVEGLIKSIKNFDEAIKKELYGSICLSGEITCIEGFETRFKEEIKQRLKENNERDFIEDVKIIAPKNRYYSALIGGAILSETASMTDWVSKKEYEEMGENIIPRKFF